MLSNGNAYPETRNSLHPRWHSLLSRASDERLTLDNHGSHTKLPPCHVSARGKLHCLLYACSPTMAIAGNIFRRHSYCLHRYVSVCVSCLLDPVLTLAKVGFECVRVYQRGEIVESSLLKVLPLVGTGIS